MAPKLKGTKKSKQSFKIEKKKGKKKNLKKIKRV